MPRVCFLFFNFSLKDLHIDKSLAKQFVRNISTKQVKQWAKCFVHVPNAWKDL